LRPGTRSRPCRCRGVQETDTAGTDIRHGMLAHPLFLSCTVELRLTFLYITGRTQGGKWCKLPVAQSLAIIEVPKRTNISMC
jgi:hypothetical protein